MNKATFGIVLLLPLMACSQDSGPSSTAQARGLPQIQEVPLPDSAALLASASRALPRAATAREAVQQLRSRADAGDAQATCQMARELEFCSGSEAFSHRMGLMAARINADQVAALNKNDVLQTMAELAKVRNEYCEGMHALSPSESVAMWRRAAMRGHLPSMLHYGSGLAFRQDRLLDTLDELMVFRRDAAEVTKRVARSGHLQANLMLARAYAPRMTGPDRTPLLRQAVQPDAAQSLAYYMLAEQLQRDTASASISPLGLQTETKGLRLMMSPGEVVEGERRFDELRRLLAPTPAGQFDPVAQSERDANQPVPGTELCERDEFVLK